MKLSSDVLWRRWGLNAQSYPNRDAIIHWTAEQSPFRWTWSKLLESAQKHAQNISDAGIRKGDVCALIIPHHPEFYPLYMAVVALGAIPTVLQYPNPRIHPEKYRQGLEGMSRHSGLDWILTEKALEEKLVPSVSRPGSTIKGLLFPLEKNAGKSKNLKIPDEIERIQSKISVSDECLLQHSSGTTGLQKAVTLSHEAVLGHVDTYAKSIGIGESDKIVSWLPLYHDMGLIAAFHLSLARAVPLVQMSPFDWITAPSLLSDAVSKESGTISWLPNFAFNLMADKIHEDELTGVNLGSWRMVINCSEPVRRESMSKFLEKFKSYGLKEQSLSAAYAMAETVFAATQCVPGKQPREISLDRGSMAAKICVSSGKAVTGCKIRVVDDIGKDVPDGEVGELAIRSKFMFQGYRNNPDATRQALREGWYYSGDYGFRDQDEYFIVGRKKDIIIVGGNNIFPEDIEDAVTAVAGVIPGRAVAYGAADPDLGTEQVHLIAETNASDENEKKSIRAGIMSAAAAIDVTLRKIHLVPPRWLIKSSSGKPARKANRERMESHDI
ncbi:MAG: hypothetical protein A2901_07270 [Elusimicrobia bacterium RIFCSPLOWO2_01_FULL_54_10]|nr:MAG: hypothetical protein A2901_07270 [Elusimicrobia bacterium RIFCSPLOWO2_01_FULL_54_10]